MLAANPMSTATESDTMSQKALSPLKRAVLLMKDMISSHVDRLPRLLWHDGGHAYLKHNSFSRPAIREIKLRKALGGSRVAAG